MPRPRRLHQLNYETGEVIKTYNIIKDALLEHCIVRADLIKAIKVNEGRLPKKHLRFAYADGVNKPITHFKVARLNYDTGEVEKVYERIEDAAADNYLSDRTIRNVILHKGGFVKSFRLRFKYVLE